jgi:hypothetical protein
VSDAILSRPDPSLTSSVRRYWKHGIAYPCASTWRPGDAWEIESAVETVN